jgi:hypothetical protein
MYKRKCRVKNQSHNNISFYTCQYVYLCCHLYYTSQLGVFVWCPVFPTCRTFFSISEEESVIAANSFSFNLFGMSSFLFRFYFFFLGTILLNIWFLMDTMIFSTFICLFVYSSGVWIQGFAFARQMPYHLSHDPSPKQIFFFCTGDWTQDLELDHLCYTPSALSTVTVASQWHLASKISYEKSACNLSGVPCKSWIFLFLSAFKILSVSYSSLILIHYTVVYCVYLIWSSLSFLDICIHVFHQIWENIGHYVLPLFFSLEFSIYEVPSVPQALFTFLQSFSFCSSYFVISIVLSSRLLIISSICSNLSLNPVWIGILFRFPPLWQNIWGKSTQSRKGCFAFTVSVHGCLTWLFLAL